MNLSKKPQEKQIKAWDKLLNRKAVIRPEILGTTLYYAFSHKENPKKEMINWMEENGKALGYD